MSLIRYRYSVVLGRLIVVSYDCCLIALSQHRKASPVTRLRRDQHPDARITDSLATLSPEDARAHSLARSPSYLNGSLGLSMRCTVLNLFRRYLGVIEFVISHLHCMVNRRWRRQRIYKRTLCLELHVRLEIKFVRWIEISSAFYVYFFVYFNFFYVDDFIDYYETNLYGSAIQFVMHTQWLMLLPIWFNIYKSFQHIFRNIF